MTLCDELYFEITLSGTKADLRGFVSFLKSGELDDFFEFSSDYIDYDDNYADAADGEQTSFTLINDDIGIEIDELDTDEFLSVFCRAAKALDARGCLYDADDEEFSFISEEGDSYYLNAKRVNIFNDELDAHARDEELGEE